MNKKSVVKPKQKRSLKNFFTASIYIHCFTLYSYKKKKKNHITSILLIIIVIVGFFITVQFYPIYYNLEMTCSVKCLVEAVPFKSPVLFSLPEAMVERTAFSILAA